MQSCVVEASRYRWVRSHASLYLAFRLIVNQRDQVLLLKTDVLSKFTHKATLGSLTALPGADRLLPNPELLPQLGLGQIIGEPLTS
jgi:hypothetical protein